MSATYLFGGATPSPLVKILTVTASKISVIGAEGANYGYGERNFLKIV